MVKTAHSIRMRVSITFIIYGKESCSTPPDLKISNDNGHAHRTSFSGHAQSFPTNRHAYRTVGHTGHAHISEHVHRTSLNQYMPE